MTTTSLNWDFPLSQKKLNTGNTADEHAVKWPLLYTTGGNVNWHNPIYCSYWQGFFNISKTLEER